MFIASLWPNMLIPVIYLIIHCMIIWIISNIVHQWLLRHRASTSTLSKTKATYIFGPCCPLTTSPTDRSRSRTVATLRPSRILRTCFARPSSLTCSDLFRRSILIPDIRSLKQQANKLSTVKCSHSDNLRVENLSTVKQRHKKQVNGG